MSSQQLKDLFEAGLASPAADTVDVDAAIAAGRRRRRTRVGATVLASAAAVVVAGLLVAGLLPPRTTGSVSPGGGTPLPIPTSQWKDGDAGMEALGSGVLVLRADGCLVLGGGAVVVWPAGFTAVERGGSVDVIGTDGSVVARTGEQVSFGGGFSSGGLSGPCLAPETEWFVVNQAPPYDRTPATEVPAVWSPAATVADLEGTWLATELGGQDVAGAVDLRGDQLVLVVQGSGLRARDGECNYLGAGLQVQDEGRLVLSPPSLTAVGCGRGEGWPAAGSAAYEAEAAYLLEPAGDAPRRLQLLREDGTVLGEYVEAPASAWDESTAGYLCLQRLASGDGLVDVTHARLTSVLEVRDVVAAADLAGAAVESWERLSSKAPAAWCTSRAGDEWSIAAVATGAEPIVVQTAGTPLGDPGADGPAIP